MKVELEEQVLSFIRRLPPENRKITRAALRGLERGNGDIKALEGDLGGFYRLRVGRIRIIFWYVETREGVAVRCVYADFRSIVYELFARMSARLRG